jgi:hypothetical protein
MPIEKMEISIPRDNGDGENSYIILQFPGMRGVRIFARVSKIASKVLSPLMKDLDKEIKVEDLDLSSLSPAIDAIADEILKDEKLILDLLDGTKLKRGEYLKDMNNLQNFDETFKGSYFELVKLLFEVLKFNYGASFKRNFFQGVLNQKKTPNQ